RCVSCATRRRARARARGGIGRAGARELMAPVWRRRSLAPVFLLTFFLLAPLATADTPPMSQHDIEEGLTCQCGCGLTVASCNHLECGFAVPVRKDIAESLARGETGEQILDRYKKEYGEKVLSSPIPQGFNLLAWIGPYAGIFLAGSLMFAFFRRRA